MKNEVSAGAVIFFLDSEKNVLYLVLHYAAGHWDLAKGHIEENETSQEAALREIVEETGLQVQLEDNFEQSYEYFYKDQGGQLIHKKAIFFVARAHSHSVKLSFEHLSYKWLPFHEAIKQVTFANTRQLLQLADQWIKQRIITNA
jgi:8-oxo-dGTP pyrophosphatase MutT (NUDIX family)